MIFVFVVLTFWASWLAWWASAKRAESRLRGQLVRHEHTYDTVEIERLPSEWEEMIKSLGLTKNESKKMMDKYTQDKLAELTQQRILVKARCACSNTRVVLVHGKQATPFLEGNPPDMTRALAGR